MKGSLVFPGLVSLLLVACAAETPAPSPIIPTPRPEAATVDPAALFAQNCASCHGLAGEGLQGPALTNLENSSDEKLIRIITNGRSQNGMPSWGDRLSQEEIVALVGYLRSLGGAEVPAEVKEQPGEAPAAGTLDLSLNPQDGEVVAKALLLDSQGHPVAGQEVAFNLLIAVGGKLNLGTAVTDQQGLAEFRYNPGEAPRVNLEASYQAGENQEPIRAQGELEIARNQEIPPISPGLYSPVPPLFAIAILGTVIGGVWLTYAWVGWQLLHILRSR